jgi:hypothetical protein
MFSVFVLAALSCFALFCFNCLVFVCVCVFVCLLFTGGILNLQIFVAKEKKEKGRLANSDMFSFPPQQKHRHFTGSRIVLTHP